VAAAAPGREFRRDDAAGTGRALRELEEEAPRGAALWGASMAEAQVTTDHDEIRRWAEERGGRPASVRGTGDGPEAGLLRIDFEPDMAEGLELISWDDFFEKFDAEKLGFLHQDKTQDGSISRFHKFVDRT
jgi:hypothetical protein